MNEHVGRGRIMIIGDLKHTGDRLPANAGDRETCCPQLSHNGTTQKTACAGYDDLCQFGVTI